jgi:hypothetical protein
MIGDVRCYNKSLNTFNVIVADAEPRVLLQTQARLVSLGVWGVIKQLKTSAHTQVSETEGFAVLPVMISIYPRKMKPVLQRLPMQSTLQSGQSIRE